MALKISAKSRLVRKSERIADLLNAHGTMVPKHFLRLNDDVVGNPVGSPNTRFVLDDSCEILWREVLLFSIETHLLRLAVMRCNGSTKA